MFNRANKMTALLVAAAAVVSLVPATGVNAAEVTRIPSKDGKIYHAVAYKDGHFYVDGEVDGKDEAAYFYEGGKANALGEIDSNSIAKAYGEKYVDIEDGDYYVDLTNGKVKDDNIKDELSDDAGSALRKTLKDNTDDRYDEANTKESRDKDDLYVVSGNKFGESWYYTEVKAASDCTSNDKAKNFNVFTDAKGNYIDADYNLGKIKVKVNDGTTTCSAVNIENTDKEYEGNVKKDLTASIRQKAVLGQDDKNIYRYAELTLKVEKNGDKDQRIVEVNGKKLKDANDVVVLPVIQKISKEQASGDIDGAKYAKTVSTYVVSNDDADIAKNDDKNNDDYDKILKLLDDVADIKDDKADNKAHATISNGKIVVYRGQGEKEVLAQTATLKTKAGWYYTDCEGDSKEDVDHTKDSGYALDVDVEGNLWRLDGGFIYKWDNKDDWDKVYKVDGSMDQLSVYNKDNMVVWNEDDEVYSVIGQKEEKEDKPEVEVKAGWTQAADGTWTFVKDGVKATGWLQDGANWYLLNDAGIMQTGWQTVGGTWYYLAGNGAMQTGWQNLGGNWYFLQPSGAMVTGWYNDNGTWYFCDGSGKMLANTTVNGYVLGANGAWVK
ncbi:N-acetylmuramoyl-L-alanine amidase family protein [Clostridium botulinum]|uniref:N-acetylmuramoyl-L-alanine amidase family protein n=1 Tax=Clostridium botulinum TaxID=1491 RepID=UPI0019676365|nr:N-acetylmuramoyl-L-alanine amidase family protein [Clostridium botulinum]MBN1066002.1 N-acetylmuramoyl-L-alanine amidase family protein [Clostridium botulinum]